MVPLYLKYMGAEAYGLIGFFSMIQVWFAILDMGLSPTVARETARYKGGATDVIACPTSACVRQIGVLD
jgi:O-antigen/teichoic acid export membrane protein